MTTTSFVPRRARPAVAEGPALRGTTTAAGHAAGTATEARRAPVTTELVVDPDVLTQLAQEVGRDGARRFVERYRSALGRRLAELHHSLRNIDLAAAYDVALNLSAGAAMVGAPRLATVAGEIAARLRVTIGPSQAELQALLRLARETDAELGRLLHHQD